MDLSGWHPPTADLRNSVPAAGRRYSGPKLNKLARTPSPRPIAMLKAIFGLLELHPTLEPTLSSTCASHREASLGESCSTPSSRTVKAASGFRPMGKASTVFASRPFPCFRARMASPIETYTPFIRIGPTRSGLGHGTADWSDSVMGSSQPFPPLTGLFLTGFSPSARIAMAFYGWRLVL